MNVRFRYKTCNGTAFADNKMTEKKENQNCNNAESFMITFSTVGNMICSS